MLKLIKYIKFVNIYQGVTMKKTFAALSAVLVFAALCTAFYLSRQINVFGTDVKANATSITFDGDEVSGFDELMEKLSFFPFLKKANLGTFPIYPEQEEELLRLCPEIEFEYALYKKLCSKSFPADSTELDLSDVKLNGTSEIFEGLGEFEKAECVVFGENVIKASERDELTKTFPNIEFKAIASYDIYGRTVREDAESIDLSGITPDDTLCDRLSVFHSAKYIDLHDVELTEEEKLTLAESYPDIEFGMTAQIAGLEFDTSSEFLDLNWTPIYDLEAFERSLKLFPRAAKIEMCGCYVSNEDMEALCEKYPDIKFVWRVYMGQWSVRTDAVAFSVLIVNYEHKRLTSKDIEVLKYCPDLEALDLGHQALTDISCIPEYMPKLRVLILADNMISDLSPLSKLKHLHYLEFFVNRVTDLSPLAECKELVDLNISYNYAISDITPLLDLPLLERLWLEHVSVSNADVQLLRETYPEARIVNVGKGSIDQGWRGHERYWAMIDMYHNDYISESFSKYDGLVFPD